MRIIVILCILFPKQTFCCLVWHVFKLEWFRTRENLAPLLFFLLYGSFLISVPFHIGSNSSPFRIYEDRPFLRSSLSSVPWDNPSTYYISNSSLTATGIQTSVPWWGNFDIQVAQWWRPPYRTIVGIMHTGSLVARQSLFRMFSRSEGWVRLRCDAVPLCGSHPFERKSFLQTLRRFPCFVQVVWRNARHSVF